MNAPHVPAASPRSRQRRRKAERRRRLLIIGGVTALLVLISVAARPSYHWLKTRRANHFAAEADKLMQEGKWNAAASKYRAALQLTPLGYRPLAGAARLATRFQRPEASQLWREVMRVPQCTNDDRQRYAALLLRESRIGAAGEIIEALLRTAPDAKTLSLATQFETRMGDDAKALEFARLSVSRAPGDETRSFALAEILARSSDPTQRGEAREILWRLADGGGAAKKSALEALARAPDLTPAEQQRAFDDLHALPEKNVVDDLLAAELQLKLHPESAGQIYQDAIEHWQNAEPVDVAELARWLNTHGESERVLALLPAERAVGTESLLLARLDALANLQRWTEIDALLETPSIALDPSVLESFRARSAMGRGSSADAERHWDHALSLSVKEPGKLRFVANFADESGATAVALNAYEQLARFPEQAQFANRARQRLTRANGDATVARASAERIAALSPDDPNAQAELLRWNLLLGLEIDSSFEKIKTLATQFPTRLSFRVTAALGYLRKHNPAAALGQFDGPPIDWSRTPPAWRAIYAAVLLANHREDAAAEIIRTIPVDQLTEPERELIATD